MAKGKIKRLMRERGFGFIAAEDGREIFFHQSELQNISFSDLHEEDQLEFDVAKGDKGPKAENIKKIAQE
jgi:CspA family cold shock protein